jgi:hypothetical protein
LSGTKIIVIAGLLLVGFNLLLYGFLKRRIAAAKRNKGIE